MNTQILKKERIKSFTEEIRRMSRFKLIKYFSASSSKKVKASLIIKNQIWQTFTNIKEGIEETPEGNLRSYWYSHIKPTLARVGLLSSKHDHYQTMLDAFNEMVREHKLFSYADFNFDDDNFENTKIATNMFNVIVFAEKAGWFRTLKEIQKQYGMTITALKGMPSLLSTEYLVHYLKKVTSLDQKFYLLSAVDYDPSGFIIAGSFVEQLQSYGLKDIELIHLITLENYPPEDIELFKFQIPSKYQLKVKKWIKETGGIDGKAFGLEADSMSRSQYKELVKLTLKNLGLI